MLICACDPTVCPIPAFMPSHAGTELLEDQIKNLPFEIAVKVRG